MPTRTAKSPARKTRSVSKRAALSPSAIIDEAIVLADAEGAEVLSMRRLASALGVEAMSLYNHVQSKDELLTRMTDQVWAAVYLPRQDREWQTEIRLRYLSARTVVLAHPWVAKLIESRRSGAALLAATNAVVGCLRAGGFPIHLAYRALLVFDSYLYGFAFQEVSWPHQRSELPQVVEDMLPDVPEAEYPHLVELMAYVARTTAGPPTTRSPLEYRAEFEFGLDLLLQGFHQTLMRELGLAAGTGDALWLQQMPKRRDQG